MRASFVTEIYANNCNSENLSIALLILQKYSFIIMMLFRNAIITIYYAKKFNDKTVAILEKSKINVFVTTLKSFVN